MGKFRKVAETQEIPDYIEKSLMPQETTNTTDIYGSLRESAIRHRQVIARETIGNNREARNVSKDWERIAGAEVYDDPRMNPEDAELSNLQAYDTDPRAVRRAGSYIDNGENTRPGINGIKFGTEDEIMAILMRGTTMFDDDIESMSSRLIESQKEKSLGMRSAEKRARQQLDRQAQWEKEKMQTLKPRKYASSRANPLIRTSVENVADGAFGLIDYSALDAHEEQVNKMIDNKRTERLAIKQIGKSPEEKRQEWEENVDAYAQTFQNYKSDWLEDIEF